MSYGIMSLLSSRGREYSEQHDAGALLDMAAEALRSGNMDTAAVLTSMSIASSLLKIVEKLEDIESSVEGIDGR